MWHSVEHIERLGELALVSDEPRFMLIDTLSMDY